MTKCPKCQQWVGFKEPYELCEPCKLSEAVASLNTTWTRITEARRLRKLSEGTASAQRINQAPELGFGPGARVVSDVYVAEQRINRAPLGIYRPACMYVGCNYPEGDCADLCDIKGPRS